jgi:glutathione S-transferase
MLLIGVNRSPYTRRVAITLAALGVAYEQRCLSGFGNRDEVRRHNPLGRIPALVLDDGETLIDSGAIVDFRRRAIRWRAAHRAEGRARSGGRC